jgi:O-antigen ligase
MICALRRTPKEWHGKIASVLCAMGIFELAYVLHQWAGYDLLWGPLVGGKLTPLVQPLGTLGTVDAAGAYLAITAPLMPWWILGVVFFAVWQTHSVSATLALAAGLAVRYRKDWIIGVPAVVFALALAYWSAFHKSLNPIAAHLTGRGSIWAFAASDWIKSDPVLGYGLGGWAQRIPNLQVQAKFAPTGELWREAHNEYFQWICEAGIVGLLLLGLWLWAHRGMFTHPVWGGSIAALGVNSLTFFPLHVVSLALVGIIIVGLATAPAVGAHIDTPEEWGSET